MSKQVVKRLFKQFLKPSTRLYKFLSYLYNYSDKSYLPQKIESIHCILENISSKQPKVRFIQVGSNDGISGDPIYKYVNTYDWYGVLIEPIPFLFGQLKNNYQNLAEKLHFLNIAISADDNSYKILYSIDEQYKDKVPAWYFQLASFNKEVLYHHNIDGLDTYIKPIDVPTLPLQKIIDEYMEGYIDLLHIDTEGYDFEILKTLDFKKTLPKIILIEYIHLDVAERKKMVALLKAEKYKVYRCGNDLIAVHATIHKFYFLGSKKYPRYDTA